MTELEDAQVAAAKETLEALGYTVIKTKSYLREQEKRRVAEARLEWAEEHNEGTRRWAHEAFVEERYLRDRCNFLYSVAIEHGASREELANQPLPQGCRQCGEPFCKPACGPTHAMVAESSPHETEPELPAGVIR